MGHVYLLKADRKWQGKHLVKIGMTNKPDVSDRVRSIQKDWQDDRGITVTYLSSFETRSPSTEEAELHRKWQHRRLYNQHLWDKFGAELSGDSEWFAVDNSELRSLTGCSRYSTDRIPWLGIGAVAAIVVITLGFLSKPKSTIPADTLAAINGDRVCTTNQLANIRNPNPIGTPTKIQGQTIGAGSKVTVRGREEWLEVRSGHWAGKRIHSTMCN